MKIMDGISREWKKLFWSFPNFPTTWLMIVSIFLLTQRFIVLLYYAGSGDHKWSQAFTIDPTKNSTKIFYKSSMFSDISWRKCSVSLCSVHYGRIAFNAVFHTRIECQWWGKYEEMNKSAGNNPKSSWRNYKN